jgi:ubiquitin-protein ligase
MNTQLTDINKQLSNCVIPKLLSGRLKKDCELLLDKGGTININNDIGNKNIIIELSRQEGLYINKYCFMVPLDYPFLPPKIKINETEYINFCILRSDRFVTALKYIKGIECLCCHSYMCKINWTPGLNLNHILIQINEYKKIKYNIALKILADKIKEKYLNSYIDLDSWLYLIQKS